MRWLVMLQHHQKWPIFHKRILKREQSQMGRQTLNAKHSAGAKGDGKKDCARIQTLSRTRLNLETVRVKLQMRNIERYKSREVQSQPALGEAS